jgi:hypothetical protein
MNTHPTVGSLVFRHEHDVRVAQARRRHRADEAVVMRGRHPLASAIGRHLGDALIAAGKRLQGGPSVEPVSSLQPRLRA